MSPATATIIPTGRRRRVALTGGIAAGKSTVAELLERHGAVIIDSDVIAREVVAPGTHGLAQVVERFGRHLLTPDGALDRAALGRIVFSDPQARRDLEAITHPLIIRRSRELSDAAAPGAVVVQVIPLLVETGQVDRFDAVVVVDAHPDEQLRRLVARNGLEPQQARDRIAAQATRTQRLAVATHVIDNTDHAAPLPQQVDALWRELVATNP
ncbi:dephospho-CoA kinase [Propionibacteriaceae bacterium G1746]|uniref:dephospho-CoA kinase n=1 Tax=Aestuariimicrobium sp. G57 TaxID=3418485 RepID=UPI003C173641